MNKSILAFLMVIALCFFGCRQPLTPVAPVPAALDYSSVPVYFLGSEAGVSEQDLSVSVQCINPEQLSTLKSTRYILFVAKEVSASGEMLEQIALAGNPVIMLGGAQSMSGFEAEAMETQQTVSASDEVTTTNSIVPAARGYFSSADGAIYSYESPIVSAQAAYLWALESLAKSKAEASAVPRTAGNWQTYISRNKTVDVYYDSGTMGGRYNIRTKWLKLANDPSSAYDYFVWQVLLESVPGNIVKGNGWGTDWMRMDMYAQDVYTDNYLDSYKPTSSSGSRTFTIGFGVSGGIGISATGPDGNLGLNFGMSWSYEQPDIVCQNQSDLSEGRAKWVYDITWDSNPGKNTSYVEPGAIIRVKQGRGLKGVKEQYECAYYWKNFWRWKSVKQATVWASVQ